MNWIKPICLSLYKKSRRAAKKTYSSPFEITALEPKILLSAELLGGTVDATSFSLDNHHDVVDTDTGLSEWLKQVVEPIESTGTSASTVANDDVSESLPDDLVMNGLAQFFEQQQQDAQNDQDMGQLLADAALSASHANDQPLELIIIDPRTPDYLELVKGVSTDSGSDYLVYMLDAEQDGVQQVSDLLAQHQDLNAVHLISHGSSEGIQLGTTWLDNNSLAEYQDQISDWSAVFDDEADILIYGCDLAGAAAGEQLIQSLAQLTGADVAASSDLTGAASKGGDWDLEYQVGAIETSIAFSQQTQQLWQGTLATFVVDTFNDSIDINLGDGLAIDADGNTSLRAAIMEANFADAEDTIQLGVGTYTLGLAGLSDNNSETGDLDINSKILIEGVGDNSTQIDGAGIDRVFEVRSNGDLTLSDLTVQGGLTTDEGGGIYVQNNNAVLTLNQVIVSDNQAREGAGIYNKGVMTLTNVEISGNTTIDLSSGTGGGLHNRQDAVSLTNVTISGNSAGLGGGIYNERDLTLTNVTVSGNNSAGAEGGGIYNDDTLTLKNTTIVNNSAQTQGGGIFNSSVTNISNTIVANNTATGSGNDAFGIFISDGSNLIEDVTGNASFGADITGTDPALAALADNGGFTQTHAITTGSAAYNSGTNTGAPAEDQRGIARDDATADIGAYEYKANNPPTATNLTQVQTYSEGNGSVELGNIVITDADAGDTVTATLTLADIAAGSLSTGTFGASTSTYTAGTGVWTITGTVADVNSALASVAFVPATDHDTDTTISTHLEDAAATGPADGTINLNVTAQNDAPTATNLDQTISYGPGQFSIPLNDIVVTDVDTNEIITARLVVASILDGSLTTGTYGSATSSYNGLTGVWQITGSVADVNAALADVVFTRALSLNGQTTITTQIQDQLSSGPANGTIDIDLSSVNTASTATNLDQTIAYSEDDVSVALEDIVVSDIDVYEVITATLTLADIAAGSLSTGTYGASTSTYTAGTGVWTVTGTVTDVNAALVAVAFMPATNHDTDTNISVHIEDAAGAGPTDGSITLDVTAVNDDPSLNNAVLDQLATEDSAFSFTLPNDTFEDADTGAVITYSAQLSGGAPLPAWLDFNASTRTFSGTPVNADVGTLTIEVIADDSQGGTPASDTFEIVVANSNDDPTLDQPIANQAATEDSAFSFTFAASTFGDVDVSNTLTYSAELSNGDALPVWLDFDANTRTFSGTPTNGDVGTISIEVSADDGQGGTPATDVFNIVVANTNDTPTGSLVISGIATEDQTLTADTSSVADDDGLAAFDYQWLRNGLAISGANASTYTLGDADVGTSISVQISYTDVRGEAESLTSTGTPAIANVNDAPVGAVSITGSATLGSTLSASNNLSDDDGLSSITYQWQRSGLDIIGATGATYTLGITDIGSTINVVASYTDLNDTPESVSSLATTAVTAVNNAPSGSVMIIGTAQEEQVLAADTSGLFDADGLGTYSYQWQADGSNIAGAVASTYTLDDSEVGKVITVVVSYNDGLGTAESVVSDPTSAVANVNDTPTATNLNQSKFYAEGAGSVALDDIVITEADAGQSVSATLTLNNVSVGALTTGTFGVSTSTYDGASGVWTVSGSVADVNAALAAVSFVPQTNNDLDTSISSHIEDAVGTGPADGIISLEVTPQNDDPTLDQALADQNATEDSAFSFTFAVNSFSDLDSADSLSYSALLSSGAALPVWLNFDAATRTFSGTPANGDIGILQVEVFADDGQGGMPASDLFSITIANINDAPTLDQAIGNQSATEDSAFSFTFNAATFSDVDVGDTLTYSALQSDGSALPAWLNFDDSSRTFSGTPTNSDVGSVTVEVTANDGNGGTVTDTFDIVVANSNDAPTLDQMIPDQVASEDLAYSFTFNAATFGDVDIGDTFSYTAIQSDGSTLPTWLSFDANSRTFSGTPANTDVGNLTVEVIADDGNGGSVSDTFELVVSDSNDAPTGGVQISGSSAVGESLTADTSLLSDEDGLGLLNYQWLKNGSAIVGAESASYVVTSSDVGSSLSVRVSYVDGGGSSEALSSASIFVANLAPDDLPEIPEEIEIVLPPASPPPAEEAPEEVEEEEESEESEETDEEGDADELLGDADTTSRFSGGDADRFENSIDAIDIPDFARDLSSDSNSPVASIVFDGPQEGTIEEKEAIYKEGASGMTSFEEDPLLLIQTSNFIKGLDNMREEVNQGVSLGKTAVGSSFALSAGVSAGYVAWLARSGVLLSSVLSSLPVWRFVDPLPVLSRGSEGPMFKDEESLESLVAGDGASATGGLDGDASLPEGQEGKNNDT